MVVRNIQLNNEALDWLKRIYNRSSDPSVKNLITETIVRMVW